MANFHQDILAVREIEEAYLGKASRPSLISVQGKEWVISGLVVKRLTFTIPCPASSSELEATGVSGGA